MAKSNNRKTSKRHGIRLIFRLSGKKTFALLNKMNEASRPEFERVDRALAQSIIDSRKIAITRQA